MDINLRYSPADLLEMPQKDHTQIIEDLLTHRLVWDESCFRFLVHLFSGGAGPFPTQYPVRLLNCLVKGMLSVDAVPYRKVRIPDTGTPEYMEFRDVRQRRNEVYSIQELRWWAYNWLKEQGEPQPVAQWSGAHFFAPTLHMELTLSKYNTDWVGNSTWDENVHAWAHICEQDDYDAHPPLVYVFRPTPVFEQHVKRIIRPTPPDIWATPAQTDILPFRAQLRRKSI